MPNPLDAPVKLIQVDRVPQHVPAIGSEHVEREPGERQVRIVRAEVTHAAMALAALRQRTRIQAAPSSVGNLGAQERQKVLLALGILLAKQLAGAELLVAEILA